MLGPRLLTNFRLVFHSWRMLLAGLGIIGGILTGIYLLRSSSSPTHNPPALSPNIPGNGALFNSVFITIEQEGIYQISHTDLEKLGWGNANPNQLQLTNHGTAIPLWVHPDTGSFNLYFYGKPTDSRYTQKNVYLLARGQGSSRRMVISLPRPAKNLANLSEHITRQPLEQNNLYEPLAKGKNHWFWMRLVQNTSEQISFPLDNSPTGQTEVLLGLWGKTQSLAVNPDHHIWVWVNNSLVGDLTWDGMATYDALVNIPQGLLQENENHIRLEIPGDTGAPVEIALLDKIEIIQNQPLPTPTNDRLIFEANSPTALFTGFSSTPTVFQVSNPQNVQVAETVPGQALEVIPGERYMAVGAQGYLHPLQFRFPADTPTLRDPALQAAYIAVGPPELLEPLQPLLDWRTAQGLEILPVPLQAVYDQFNDGLPAPEAIQAFLQYAARNWTTPPQYLLLLGDGSTDPFSYLSGSHQDILPSFFIETAFGGETVSDIGFARLDDDLIPDLAIGRVPASTPAQVKTFVQKTLAFEQANPNEVTRRMVAVADPFEASFEQDARRFLDSADSHFQTVLLAPAPGETDTNTKIATLLEKGVLFMAYFGHGSLLQLGKDRLFTTQDAAALTNHNHLSIMINMTCLSGLYTHPQEDSLVEVMLWNANGGAVATLAATSLTLSRDQQALSNALTQVLNQFLNEPESSATLGNLLLQAQRQVPLNLNGPREVVETFLLFGDPALRLPLQP